MFSFFKSKKPPERQLNDASQLMTGDMLQIIDSFAYPSWLKGQILKVNAVQTYQYERSSDTEFVLETDSGKVVFLQIEKEDGEQWANLSIKVQREDVDAIFTLDEFARIFDEEELTQIQVKNKPDAFSHFLSDEYQQTEAPYVAYFHQKDYRNSSLPRYREDSGESCEIIVLESPEGDHSINIEVWEGGETEVSLTYTRPLTDIVDLFPGN